MKNTPPKTMLRRIYRYIRPHRGRIALSLLASLCVSATEVSYAKLVQPLMDDVLAPGGLALIHLVPVIVIGLSLFKGIARYFQSYFIRTAGQLVVQDIRNDIFGHSLGLSMGYFSRNTSGNLMSRILNDVGEIDRTGSSVVVDLVREGATLIGLVAVAFYSDWKLASLAFIVFPVVLGPAASIGRRIKGYSRRGQAAMGNLTSALEQAISGIKVIKAFGTEENENRNFQNENMAFYKFRRKLIKYESASTPLVEILASLGVAAVLWYGMQRVLSGAMTQGEFTSIIVAIVMMYTPLRRLTRVNNMVQQGMGAAERVFEVLDEKAEITDVVDAEELPRVKGEVTFERVTFAYDSEPVLTDFSVRAAPGEVIALVGPSGAGKSTIAGLLNRFYDPRSGAILIDGRDIRQVTLDSLRRNISLVDQETFLFNDTIADNIRYGRPEASDAEVVQAARLAYADEFIEQMPSKYESRIGDRGLRLSGGQRQRLCIARALLRDTPILILDEATSALDTESEAMVQKALANLMQNRTTFVIAHRLSTIMHADRIVVLEEGRVREVGRHQQLLGRDGLYKRLYNMQFQA